MSSRPFRFIHASDFHLERPLMGVAEVPDHLRELFLEAPYTAARRVFEAALVEDVKFVVLSGGIIAASVTGPCGPLFLAEQFTRLAERGIGVYWAGAMTDPPEVWPAAVRLPQNVHVFARGRDEDLLVQSDTGPVARVTGISCDDRRPWQPTDFQPDSAGLYTIAVAHGQPDLTVLQTRGLQYVALGGRHDRSTPLCAAASGLSQASVEATPVPPQPPANSQVAHYCGTPQGRRPEEGGIHGCTLVQVDEQRQTRTSLIPTDAARWISERLLIDEGTTADDLESRVRERMHALLEAAPATALLVSWTIAGRGPLLGSLRRVGGATALLDRLRGDYGYRQPAAWSVSIEVELSETLPPEWYEQETIRGDFLRAIRQLQMNPDEPLALEQYLAETHRAGTLAAAVAFPAKAAREAVLREAAALGVDLLSGGEDPSMKITNLDVDGFGVWSGLRIERFSDALNVFYGPNEAGKTTLLQFIRSMLYGFSPQRQHYLPPLHGGRGGGTLDVAGPHGRFQISRHDTAADGTPGEQLTLTAPDGTRQGEHFVKVLLSNVDETVFNNVFAVGLREIQELATLSGTDAAELLYNLTAGLDRVSLVEVLQELDASRNRILDAAGRPCQVLQLLADYEKLRAEIEELASVGHRYGHLAAEREQLHAEITQLEEEANRVDRLARVADLALVVRDRWTQRATLDEQLSAIGPLKIMPEGAGERFDAITARIQRHQEHVDRLAQQTAALRAEFAGLAINEALWRQAARIEAFKEQMPWIAQLQSQIGELEKEIAGLDAELTAESERLGIGATKGAHVGMAVALPSPVSQPSQQPPKTSAVPFPFDISRKRLASLRPLAKLLQQAWRRSVEARQTAARAADNARTLAEQIELALADHGQSNLAAALDGAGNLVSQYRRRVQIDERLDQLARHRTELEERSRDCSQRQLLPINMLAVLGAVFVLGMVLVLSGLFLSGPITGGIGWGLVVVGLGGIATAVGSKTLIERSNERQLAACQKQLATLKSQVEQTEDDRDALDAEMPRGGGPIVSRLQTAESELAALEAIALDDAKRSAAQQDADLAARRAEEAQQSLKTARRRWREALAGVGLPDTIAPKQVRRLVERGDWIAETQRRLSQRREELARRTAELDAFAARIVQLAADAGVSLTSVVLVDQLHELAEAAARQATFVERREAIRRERRGLRVVQRKREEAIGRQKHRRRQLFIEVGVKDEQEFRQRALECGRTDVLRRQREAIAREIEAALASQCSEEAIRQQLANDYPGLLEGRSGELRQRLAGIQSQLRGLLEKRGRLSEQLESLAADRRMASKRLDLAVLEKRLEDAVHRWQVLAATCRTLDVIRDAYQQHRQPETLQEASGYLDRLTQGRYRRVWTPLGDRSLRVDDAEGRALPVESLSRGTREQLFLSLRLALASSYARRGSPLPLVLDDVLVNFDAERAKAAAAVLRDFAAEGHQLLVFTCHEHIHKLFKSLRVPVSRLPSNAQPGPAVVMLQAHSEDEEKPKRERSPRQPRRKTAAKLETPGAEDAGFREDGEEEEIDDLRDEVADEDDSLWEGEDDEFDDLDDNAAA